MDQVGDKVCATRRLQHGSSQATPATSAAGAHTEGVTTQGHGPLAQAPQCLLLEAVVRTDYSPRGRQGLAQARWEGSKEGEGAQTLQGLPQPDSPKRRHGRRP
jgi:hypothetical protein